VFRYGSLYLHPVFPLQSTYYVRSRNASKHAIRLSQNISETAWTVESKTNSQQNCVSGFHVLVARFRYLQYVHVDASVPQQLFFSHLSCPDHVILCSRDTRAVIRPGLCRWHLLLYSSCVFNAFFELEASGHKNH
jgi:hypothetical protein